MGHPVEYWKPSFKPDFGLLLTTLSTFDPAVRHCPAVRREPHRRPRDEGEAEGDAPEEEPALRGADDRERCFEVEQVASHEGVFCGQNLIFVARTQRKAHKIQVHVPSPLFLNISRHTIAIAYFAT